MRRLRREPSVDLGAKARPSQHQLQKEMAQTDGWRLGRVCPLCPGISDINLFRYCQGIVYFDPKISDRAFDLGVAKEKWTALRLPVRR